MIKAIIFDVGGVLLRTQEYSYRRNWEKKLGLKEWKSETIVFNSEMGQKAQQGHISDDQLWDWVGKQLDLQPADLTQFRHDFWAGDVLDIDLIDYIRQLQAIYQTAIISNYGDGLRPFLITHQIDDAFDEIIISAEEKVMKPDARIYQIALAKLGRKPEEAVFIDDFMHNVEGARNLGMHAIHFTPQTDLATELEKLGVEHV